jgi:hypothetical protein
MSDFHARRNRAKATLTSSSLAASPETPSSIAANSSGVPSYPASASSAFISSASSASYKRVIGDALRSRTKGRQMTEVAIAAASLNRMIELGRPEYVRLT